MGPLRHRLSAAVLAALLLAPHGEAQARDPYAKVVDAYNRSDVDAVMAMANNGDAAAQFMLGLMYEVGRGLKASDADASRWYRLSAQQGNSDAQRNLGILYESGRGVPKDLAEAQRWYVKSAEQGDVTAQVNLGYLYSSANGAQKNDALAAKWFRMAAEQGNSDAQYRLGSDLYLGLGVAENKAEAAQWYGKAAQQGNSGAQFMLGYMYWYGDGVQKLTEEAVRWYRNAAEQGVVGAQSFLGRIYAEGERVRKDENEAVRWNRMAAEQNDGDAQFRLGASYFFGHGVEKNYSEAFRWTAAAAEKGLAEAQSNLGVMYSNGQGVAEDDRAAARWLRLAADQGSYSGQRNLARAYRVGEGVPRDLVLAYMWLNLASAQEGALVAGAEALGASAELDEVGKLLTPSALAEAQRLSREWKPATSSGGAPNASIPSAPKSLGQVASTGSGFFITAAGHLLTNAHVVEGCTRISLSAGSRLTVLDVDPASDLALLKVGGGTSRTPLMLRQGRGVRLADSIVVAGYPLTGLLSSGLSVTTGAVSALAGPGDDRRLIQITAPVQPGNSGGPLLDSSGNVVGVVVSKLDAVAVASATGDIPQNVNFAISLGTLQAFLDANGVDYQTRASNAPKSNADVAELARASTVQIECRN